MCNLHADWRVSYHIGIDNRTQAQRNTTQSSLQFVFGLEPFEAVIRWIIYREHDSIVTQCRLCRPGT